MTTDSLEIRFHERMRQIHEQAWTECNYRATRFIQMVESQGGVETAKKLLASKVYPEGLTRLFEEERLDISMEATVLQELWCSLFTSDELEIARKRLRELGYLET